MREPKTGMASLQICMVTQEIIHFLFLFVCLNGPLPKWRKWVSHYGFCLTSGNRTNVLSSLGQVNPNTVAIRNQTRCLAQHQAAKRIQADWNSVCPWRNPGVRTAPGRTPGIVRTLCRPFWAFRWFPIHKPSSNSTVPVAWITEPTTDSCYENNCVHL